MSAKQIRYEAYLDAQQARQEARWFRDVPSLLEEMSKTINELKVILEDKPNFAEKTLYDLRVLYKEIMEAQKADHNYDNFCKSQNAMFNMVTKINSWFRSSRVAIGIKAIPDYSGYGRAKIAEKFEFVKSNEFSITQGCL